MNSEKLSVELMQNLVEVVQKNCHIADARHAGDYTLCVYLLKMREMYRWEQQASFNQLIEVDDVGDWLTSREAIWDDLEEAEYFPIEIDGKQYETFDNEAINAALKPKGLIYNAGLGIRCRPHFFIADLDEYYQRGGVDIYIASKEHARDMAAPPAMMQDGLIFIRNESLRRMLWEKVEEWRMSPIDSPLGRAVAAYDFEGNIEQALDKMAAVESALIIEHELGEVQAGNILGEKWNEMLNTLPRSGAEIMLRAIRDHLADALTTLSALLETNNPASIHFYFGSMVAMRKKIAPSLLQAYESWHKKGEFQRIQDLIEPSRQHWEELAKDCLQLYETHGVEAAPHIEQLVEQHYL